MRTPGSSSKKDAAQCRNPGPRPRQTRRSWRITGQSSVASDNRYSTGGMRRRPFAMSEGIVSGTKARKKRGQHRKLSLGTFAEIEPRFCPTCPPTVAPFSKTLLLLPTSPPFFSLRAQHEMHDLHDATFRCLLRQHPRASCCGPAKSRLQVDLATPNVDLHCNNAQCRKSSVCSWVLTITPREFQNMPQWAAVIVYSSIPRNAQSHIRTMSRFFGPLFLHQTRCLSILLNPSLRHPFIHSFSSRLLSLPNPRTCCRPASFFTRCVSQLPSSPSWPPVLSSLLRPLLPMLLLNVRNLH